MKYLYFALIFTFLISCDKNDPSPELSDEIFKDYEQELSITSKALESQEKAHLSVLNEQKKVIPQTGQIKYATKKINDSEKLLEALRQQKQFFDIKMELRKTEVRRRYLEGRHGGKKWPDEQELAVYRSTIKLQRAKIAWDKNKGMKKPVPRGTTGF